MKKNILLIGGIVLSALFVFSGFTTTESNPAEKLTLQKKEMDKRWKDYRKWYRVTNEKPNTGDPTGFLGKKRHGGPKAYREVYINKVGEAVNKGTAPYSYPEGTVVVKEAFKNKEAWQAKKKPFLTVMVKLKKGSSPKTGDWGWVMGATGSVQSNDQKMAKFCGSCHVNAAGTDYVFMNSDFLKAESN